MQRRAIDCRRFSVGRDCLEHAISDDTHSRARNSGTQLQTVASLIDATAMQLQMQRQIFFRCGWRISIRTTTRRSEPARPAWAESSATRSQAFYDAALVLNIAEWETA